MLCIDRLIDFFLLTLLLSKGRFCCPAREHIQVLHLMCLDNRPMSIMIRTFNHLGVNYVEKFCLVVWPKFSAVSF